LVVLIIKLTGFFDASHAQPAQCFGHKSFDALAKRWQEAGASLVGGCCRTTPSTIRAVSKVLKGKTAYSATQI
jgi:S-methylmethionine-dependent homocysteine/selenocysteine methylase